MSQWLRRRPVVMLIAGLTMGLLVGVGMMIGTLTTLGRSSSPGLLLSETTLHAASAHGGKSLALATGMVDPEMEGLFTLDFLTGDLKCLVLNPRTGAAGRGVFQHNVIADLGVQQGKEPDYVMVTGQANFVRGGAMTTPANCVIYVADANTGNFAAYSIFWNQNLAKAGQPQEGMFQKIFAGKARTLTVREQ